MFLLSFIPDSILLFFINGMLSVGIIGVIISFFFGSIISLIPPIAPYRLLVQIVSTVLLVGGVYFKGGYAIEMEWRQRVAELEQKVALSEQQALDATKNIQIVYIDKVKYIKENKNVIDQKIKNLEAKIDAQCKVAPEAISILNEAARGIRK